MAKKQQNHCLDFLKGIACICVVFMHCEFPGVLGTAIQCVSRFSVPLFFLISGYFCFSEAGAVDYAKKITRILRIILAVSVFYAACAVLQGALRGGIPAPSPVEWIAFLCLNRPVIIAGQMWFLFALLYDEAVFAFAERYQFVGWLYALIPVLMLVYVLMAQGAYLAGIPVGNALYRNWLIEGLPFFALGHWIHKNQWRIRIPDLALVLTALVSTVLCLVERALIGRDFGVHLSTFPQVTALFMLSVSHGNQFQGHLITRLGNKYSMLVYVLHPFVWHTLEAVYEGSGWTESLAAQAILPVLVVGISVGLSMWVTKAGKARIRRG